MSDPILIRRDSAPGTPPKVYVLNASWPASATFDADLLADDVTCEILTDTKKSFDDVNIRVDNGFALYTLTAPAADGSRIGTFVEGEMDPAPPAPAADPLPPPPSADPNFVQPPSSPPNTPPDPVTDQPPVADIPAPTTNETAPVFVPADPEANTPTPPAPVPDPVAVDPLVALQSALSAPGHAFGYAIKAGDVHPADAGLFQCGVDAFGRVWRIEEREDGEYLVLAGSLQT